MHQQQPTYSSSGGSVHNTNTRKRTSIHISITHIANVWVWSRGFALTYFAGTNLVGREPSARNELISLSPGSVRASRARVCVFRGRILNKTPKYEQTNKLTTKKGELVQKKCAAHRLPTRNGFRDLNLISNL